MGEEISVTAISNLLDKVGIIAEKYSEIESLTGQNFNVFTILGRGTDELSHSLFLGYLLNSQESHSQKDTFLKLFLKVVSDSIKKSKVLDEEKNSNLKAVFDFESAKSNVITEFYTGKIKNDYSEGGFIDILINDGKSNMILENKIYAGDQYKQIQRYHNFDKKAPILYLTLTKDNLVSKSSEGDLKFGKEYYHISFEDEITEWIQKCIKESVNQPLIRETLIQYENLIRTLTKTTKNIEMKKKVQEIALSKSSSVENLIAVHHIHSEYQAIEIKLLDYFLEALKKSFNDIEEYEVNWDSWNFPYCQVSFTNNKLISKNLKIVVEFSDKKAPINLVHGLKYIKNPENDFSKAFEDVIDRSDFRLIKNVPFLNKVLRHSLTDLNNFVELAKVYHDEEYQDRLVESYKNQFIGFVHEIESKVDEFDSKKD